MFFILSKTFNFLAQPLAVIMLMMVIGWLIRNQRWKKILLRTAFALLIITSNYLLANAIMHAWEVPVTPYKSITKTYDFGVLLTGVTKTEMTPKDRVYFGRGADRATHTLQLYKLGIIKKVIVSGGSGRLDGGGIREADDLADFLKLAGIPETDIVIENESKNTHESATKVKEILATLDGPKELLLITSGYHMRRSIACFKKMEIHADQFAADPISEKTKFSFGNLLIPKLEAMGMWQILMKEWVGFVAYWMAGYL